MHHPKPETLILTKVLDDGPSLESARRDAPTLESGTLKAVWECRLLGFCVRRNGGWRKILHRVP